MSDVKNLTLVSRQLVAACRQLAAAAGPGLGRAKENPPVGLVATPQGRGLNLGRACSSYPPKWAFAVLGVLREGSKKAFSETKFVSILIDSSKY